MSICYGCNCSCSYIHYSTLTAHELVGAGMLTTVFLPVYLSIKKEVGQDEGKYLNFHRCCCELVAVLGFFFAQKLGGPSRELILTQRWRCSGFFVIRSYAVHFSTIFSGLLNGAETLPLASRGSCTITLSLQHHSLHSFLVNTNPELGLLILALESSD